MPDLAAINAAVADFPDPETGRSAQRLDQIRDVRLEGNKLSLTLALTTWAAPLWQETKAELEKLLRAKFPALSQIEVTLAVHQRRPEPLGQVGLTSKSVIAVGSGKGGVGKSTIAATLALGLHRAGSKVGLLDTDVYGPSIPRLLGLEGSPAPVMAEGKVAPVMHDGMPVMSMGFLMPPGKAVIWRGPMLHQYVTQFLRDVSWGDLDYLIIDMPPGTGDIALSLSQALPLTGAVIVCTPQDVALIDAARAISMFQTVNIPVLGMVENMSGFHCPSCNTRHDIFGTGGAKRQAAEHNVPFLGDVPINIQVRVNGDEGRTVSNFDDVAVSSYLSAICHRLVKNLSTQRRKAPPLPSLSVLG